LTERNGGAAPGNESRKYCFDSGPGEPRHLRINNPAPGDFSVQSVGTGDGPFTVHVYSIDLDKKFGTHIPHLRITSPGSVRKHDFTLGSEAPHRLHESSPTADAGADQTVDAGAGGTAAVSLDGSLSSDPTATRSPSRGRLLRPGQRPATASRVAGRVSVVGLTVSDGKRGSDSATVTITVNPAANTRHDAARLCPFPAIGCSRLPGPRAPWPRSAPTATDAVDGSRPVTCMPASGATFALETTTVICSASDLSGNTGNGSFTITVRDTTPPSWRCLRI